MLLHLLYCKERSLSCLDIKIVGTPFFYGSQRFNEEQNQIVRIPQAGFQD